MKNIITLVFVCLSYLSALAQNVPQGIAYQAVAVKDGAYSVAGQNPQAIYWSNKDIKVRFTIFEKYPNGSSQYSEFHETTTDDYGVFNLIIGQGSDLSGDFTTIPWELGDAHLQVEIDFENTNEFVLSVIEKFWSVPFSFNSHSADTLLGIYEETDPIFNSSIAKGITSSDTTYWNNKLDSYTEIDPIFNSSVAKGITTADTAAWNNHLSADLDTDTTNEIQTISIANDSIKLSNGGGRIPLAAIKSYVNSSARSTSESVVHLSDSTTAVYVSNFDFNYWNYADSIILDYLMLKEGDRLVIYTSPTGGPLTYHIRSYWQLLDSAGNKMNCFISARNETNNGNDGFNAYSNQSAATNSYNYYQDLHYTIPADGTYFIKRAHYFLQKKGATPTPYRYPIGMWYYEIN